MLSTVDLLPYSEIDKFDAIVDACVCMCVSVCALGRSTNKLINFLGFILV